MIIDSAFPLQYGFTYNEDNDEFTKPYHNGIIILWEKRSKWELSYTDENDYQHFISKGDEDDVIKAFRVFTRDSRIDEILR